MKSLEGKRLLILGGSMWMNSIQKYAEENGITLVATGSNMNAAIFDIAQEGYCVNSIDNDAVKNLIKDKNIDGVYMGGSEIVISHACQYTNELGLPCYCTKAQWDNLQNKAFFKEQCIKHGLPVVSKYSVATEEVESKSTTLPYPVICKPTDGCGSNGFSVCRNAEEFIAGYKKAMDNSESGEVLIENFVKNDGVVCFYTLSEGKAYFSGLEDKYPVRYEKFGSYVAGMHIFESNLTDTFKEKFDDKIQNLVTDLGLKEGSFWIEVFTDGTNYYFNEAGYRYSGSITIFPVEYFYGYNQLGADIYYALTGESVLKGHKSLMKDGLRRGKKYCIYSLHLKPGVIESIEGLDEVMAMENVVAMPLAMKVGHNVPDSGTIGQVFGFVHFTFDDAKDWSDTIERFLGILKIKNKDGENMINVMIDPKNPSLIAKSL